MKTFNRLGIVFILSCFGIISSMAQLTDSLSYQTKNTTSLLPLSPCGSGNSWLRSYSFSLPASCIPGVTGIAKREDITFSIANRDFNDLLKSASLLNGKTINTPAWLTETESSGSFNYKWKRLTGRPVIDSAKAYYHPSGTAKEPVLSDYRIYRATAFLFNSVMSFNYPSAYLPARYPLTDKAK